MKQMKQPVDLEFNDLFEQFTAESNDMENTPLDKEAITLWIPVEYKEKFDRLQRKSKRRFSKVLKEVVMRSIDRVAVDQAS